MRTTIRTLTAALTLAAGVMIPTSTSAAAVVGSASSPAAAASSWLLQKSCPNNTHLVIRYKIKANKTGGLFVGRSLSAMFNNNVQVSYSKPYVRSMVYDTGMSGRVYWGHGTGAWAGSVVDHSSYGICETGV